MMLPIPNTFEAVIIQAWVFFAALLGALIIHEGAHVAALRSYGKNPLVWYKSGQGFNVGYPKDYMGLTRDQKRIVYLSGIAGGALFIAFPSLWLYPSFALGLIAVYFVGCKHDFKALWGLIK